MTISVDILSLKSWNALFSVYAKLYDIHKWYTLKIKILLEGGQNERELEIGCL
jgi:hypothetical protein